METKQKRATARNVLLFGAANELERELLTEIQENPLYFV